MSETPASIFITWAKSELGQANSPTPNSKDATVRAIDDLTWGDMTRNKDRKISGTSGPYIVLKLEVIETQHQLSRSVG
jgi:hypothetical protein